MNRGRRVTTALRIARAIATNQVARVAPSAYVRLTGQTGRGAPEAETAETIADYFHRCVDDYLAILGVAEGDEFAYLHDKVVLEYGPGDFPGVSLLFSALGARRVHCVDRFPLLASGERQARVLERLAAPLPGDARARMKRCFVRPAAPSAGFAPERLDYRVRPGGHSGLDNEVDLVLSRAVLEHVDDLAGTFADMCRAMKAGAVAVHQVDLRSHGLHEHNPLDFLDWPPALWKLMYSHKGVPNRLRVDAYRDLLRGLPLRIVRLEPTERASAQVVHEARAHLAPPFRALSDDDLSWLGFWLVLEKVRA